MTEILINADDLLNMAQKLGTAKGYGEEAKRILEGASAYVSNGAIENAKMDVEKHLKSYVEKLDSGHQNIFIARESMLGTDQDASGLFSENPGAIPQSIEKNPQAIIEWKRNHVHVEDGELVNPMGHRVAKTKQIESADPKFHGTYYVYNNGQIVREYTDDKGKLQVQLAEKIPKVLPSSPLKDWSGKKWVVKKKSVKEFNKKVEEGSVILNFLPGISAYKVTSELMTGRHMLTGEKIENIEQKREIASEAADLLPVSSNIKGGVEAATGFNPITQKEVDSITRGVGALGLFGGFLIKGGSKLVRKGDDLWGVLNKETKKVEGRGKGTGISAADDIISNIPSNATKRNLTPTDNIKEGVEYKWNDGATWRVRMHSEDLSAPIGSNANMGWTMRVQRGKWFMDSQGNWHKNNLLNKNSPFFNETIANQTHISIKRP
ncbi:polymorphic toxin type 30 domain-containing protein [Metabacillus sp. 113a]|uniref:polymorphic toxin type 30 domain-containing protein n=1 Tax=Metabacillus sp. 113a TaxID=3404706 RepID=UPI003CEC6915